MRQPEPENPDLIHPDNIKPGNSLEPGQLGLGASSGEPDQALMCKNIPACLQQRGQTVRFPYIQKCTGEHFLDWIQNKQSWQITQSSKEAEGKHDATGLRGSITWSSH